MVSLFFFAVASHSIADQSQERLGKCSALLDVAADAYQLSGTAITADYYRDASVTLSDSAVAKGLRGTIINDYLYNAHQDWDPLVSSSIGRVSWLKDNDSHIHRCIDLAKHITN